MTLECASCSLPQTSHNDFDSETFAERYASRYDSPKGLPVVQKEKRILRALLTQWSPQAKSAVEIGCGIGYFTE